MLFSPLSLLPLAAVASAVQITVKSNGGNATSAYQYGLMFEDINNSGSFDIDYRRGTGEGSDQLVR